MRISIIGAGAWGTAFSIHCARKGIEVLLWVYEENLYGQLLRNRVNDMYLPGFDLPENINFTKDLRDIPLFSKDVVIATPSIALRETIGKISAELSDKNILILTKGIENGTLLRMSEVVQILLGVKNPSVAVLSGPSFAKEVALDMFTSVVIASNKSRVAYDFQKNLHSDNFRIYTSRDVIGVELGGAMKNVMAIGAGIIEGLGLGTNTQAAYATRALVEIMRLGRAMGAKEKTFMGLSGMGDLILTSYGHLSRNRAFGNELAKGKKPEDIISAQNMVVEGYYTVKAAYELSKRLSIDMPITEELYMVIFNGKRLQDSINDIKRRALKEEFY
ncbi:MAG: NAD(P)-dependent glycerol-3-phosphate dehydrogenase [Syntrophorhabdaceae bacterium]|nr:NAD(P)-dependent glycerol-3-phosphate dehydrogenase [Syntrophorhabdaceae bacterium]